MTAKQATITACVRTPAFEVHLNFALGMYTVETTTREKLEAFLVAIGMDSQKRLQSISDSEEGVYLEMNASDFSHALKSLTWLTDYTSIREGLETIRTR